MRDCGYTRGAGGSAGSCRRAGARPAARRGPRRCPPENPLPRPHAGVRQRRDHPRRGPERDHCRPSRRAAAGCRSSSTACARRRPAARAGCKPSTLSGADGLARPSLLLRHGGSHDARGDGAGRPHDTVAPDASSQGRAGRSPRPRLLAFSSTEAGSFECQLDAGAWAAAHRPGLLRLARARTRSQCGRSTRPATWTRRPRRGHGLSTPARPTPRSRAVRAGRSARRRPRSRSRPRPGLRVPARCGRVGRVHARRRRTRRSPTAAHTFSVQGEGRDGRQRRCRRRPRARGRLTRSAPDTSIVERPVREPSTSSVGLVRVLLRRRGRRLRVQARRRRVGAPARRRRPTRASPTARTRSRCAAQGRGRERGRDARHSGHGRSRRPRPSSLADVRRRHGDGVPVAGAALGARDARHLLHQQQQDRSRQLLHDVGAGGRSRRGRQRDRRAHRVPHRRAEHRFDRGGAADLQRPGQPDESRLLGPQLRVSVRLLQRRREDDREQLRIPDGPPRRRDRVAELVPARAGRRGPSRCRPRIRSWCARRRSGTARSR